MVEVGPMFLLHHDGLYAGTSISEWKEISSFVEILNPVKLDDIEPQNQECDICRESFDPSDDGISGEKPISLPCGHIFGKDCISGWIARNAVPSVETVFTCPKCREEFTMLGEESYNNIERQAGKIEARLRFWDLVYERLGIVRSAEEEECRKFLWQFIHQQKSEQTKEKWDIWRPWFDFLAQQSGLRFALQHRQLDVTPVQRDLCDAIFNLACYGVNDASEGYCAESYEDRLIPRWCWQFEQISHQHSPSFYLFERLQRDGRQPRIGPWRRALFKRKENDLRAHVIDNADWTLWNPDVINTVFDVLNDIAPFPNDPSYPE